VSRRNSRRAKASRRTEREQQHREPPPKLQELARQSECPDCNSEVVLLHRRGGDDWDWFYEIRHDAGCPQLAWRERTGAGPSFMLIGKDGEPVPPEAVARSLEILDEHGLVPGRVAVSTDGSVPPAPSWEERELIEQAVSKMRGED
jgi:sulfur carrier protein ThiS